MALATVGSAAQAGFDPSANDARRIHRHGPVDHPDRVFGQGAGSSRPSIRTCPRCPISPPARPPPWPCRRTRRTLPILTSGFNRNFGAGRLQAAPGALQRIRLFSIYDVSGPAPVKRQVIQVPDTFLGLAWAPKGGRFYVSGGVDDDVLEYARASGPVETESGGFALRAAPSSRSAGTTTRAWAWRSNRRRRGLAVSARTAWRPSLAANLQNDSVSLIDLADGAIVEQDLRPGVIDSQACRQRPAAELPPRRWPGPPTPKPMSPASATARSSPCPSGVGRFRVGARIKTRGQPVAAGR